MADVGHTETGLRVTGINGFCLKSVGNKMGEQGENTSEEFKRVE